jgi:hypothetical protein
MKNKLEFNEVTPINYPAIEYISWFNSDTNNVQTLCTNIFKGGFYTTDPNYYLLLDAANKSIQETEDDIAKIKGFLASYVPNTKNIDK